MADEVMDIDKLEAEIERVRQQRKYAQENVDCAERELRHAEDHLNELERRLSDIRGAPYELFALARSVYIK